MSNIVALRPGAWHPAPAVELLREPLKDALVPRERLKKLRREFDKWVKLKRGGNWLLMAGGKSNYLELALLDEVMGGTAYASPALHFALWDTPATTDLDAYVGNTAGELSGGSYDRVNMTNNTTNFPSANPKLNAVAITYTTATANWNGSSNIEQMLVFDGNLKTAADNLLVWSDLTTPKPVLNGDQAQYAINAFSWTEN